MLLIGSAIVAIHRVHDAGVLEFSYRGR